MADSENDPGPGTPAPASADSVSDDHLYKYMLAAGVPADSAELFVRNRAALSPHEAYIHLTNNKVDPGTATALAAASAGVPAPDQFEAQKADFIAHHPLLDKFMGFGQGLARGVSFGTTKNFEGPDEQAVAQRNPGLVTAGTVTGAIASPANKLIGAATGALLPARAAVQGAAQGAIGGGITGFNAPAGQPGPEPTLAERFKSAGLGAAGGAALGGTLGAIAGRAQAPVVDKTLKSETNAAYQGVRGGAPITDPDFLAHVNEINQSPEGQAAFQAGQSKVYRLSGERVPDLPQPTAAPRSLAAKDPFFAKMYGAQAAPITSITPVQVDALKQGMDELGMPGPARQLLERADPLMPGYAAARGLSEAGRQATPGLADAIPTAVKAAAVGGGIATGHPGVGIGAASLLQRYLQAAPKVPLSPNALAALRGVQQQVGDLPLGQLFAQGGAAPAVATGLSHMASSLPTAAAAFVPPLPAPSSP